MGGGVSIFQKCPNLNYFAILPLYEMSVIQKCPNLISFSFFPLSFSLILPSVFLSLVLLSVFLLVFQCLSFYFSRGPQWK